MGSDSGRICILEYNAAKNSFDRVHMETYGKSGCRRNGLLPNLNIDNILIYFSRNVRLLIMAQLIPELLIKLDISLVTGE